MALKHRQAVLVGLLALLCAASSPRFAAGRVLRGLLQSDSPSDELQLAVSAFGDGILDQLANETKAGSGPGMIISPYSIAQAVAMLLNGLEPNSTSYQDLFGDDVSQEEINSQFQTLTSILLESEYPSDTGIQVKNANSAWLKEGLKWQPQYEATLQEYYNATLDTLTSAQAINSWVAEATNNKITEVVSDKVVADAVLILVNAIYFKGQWAHQFEETATKGAPFHLLDGSKMQAAMMYQQLEQRSVMTATLNTTVGDATVDCEAAQLQFADFKYAGVIAQPKGEVIEGSDGHLQLTTEEGPVDYAEALAACRAAVTESLPGGEDSQAWEYSERPVDLYLPRFEIEFSASLNQALQAIGLTAPFTPGQLTQMAEDAEGNPVQGLVVSDVLHKVYQKVNEKGAEAAAVTAIAVTTSAPAEPKPPVELRFDRPYVFSIVHWPTGLALFSGEIYKPEEWKKA